MDISLTQIRKVYMKKRDKLQIVFLFIIFIIAVVFCLASFSCQSEQEKALATLQQQESEKEEEIKKAQDTLADLEKQYEQQKKDQEEAQGNENTMTQTEEKEPENGKKVAVDPGHQGSNVDMSAMEPIGPGSGEMKMKSTGGTTGRFTGVSESELNLNISKQLRTELEKRGYEVVLTREDQDTAISNKERALLAAESGADIYVRIHANGSEDSSANGAMTMVPSTENPYVSNLADSSYLLGQCIIDAYCNATGIRNNGVQLYDNMSGINWSKIPVTILEMGFMTNQSDDENMEKPEFQVKMVQGIANGIEEYFQQNGE